MNSDGKSVSWYVENAHHFVAIGQTRIHLFGYSNNTECLDDPEVPWEHVNKVEGGGTHRWNTYINLNFTAPHPCGLTFSWSLDIEKGGYNSAKSILDVDIEGIKAAMDRLAYAPREQMQEALLRPLLQLETMEDDRKKWLEEVQEMRADLKRIVEPLCKINWDR